MSLLEKQLNGDLDLLREKLVYMEETTEAIRTLINRVEIMLKFHLEEK